MCRGKEPGKHHLPLSANHPRFLASTYSNFPMCCFIFLYLCLCNHLLKIPGILMILMAVLRPQFGSLFDENFLWWYAVLL